MKTLNAEKGLALPAGSGSPLESLANPENSVLPLPTETQGKFPPPVAPSPAVEPRPMTPEDYDRLTARIYGNDPDDSPGLAAGWVALSIIALIGFGLGFLWWGWM